MNHVLSSIPTELLASIVLMIVFFSLLFAYGFHGLLKFGKGVNYLMAVMLGVISVLLCVGLVMSAIEYIADEHMTQEQKDTARRSMLMMAVSSVVVGLLALVKYNYGKLFDALNKTLPANKKRLFRKK
jgi:hypothetical protein|tara:strand:- start:845 stop:1228 length:384 start_codon:yes stop_codon:yes gene_type:complete